MTGGLSRMIRSEERFVPALAMLDDQNVVVISCRRSGAARSRDLRELGPDVEALVYGGVFPPLRALCTSASDRPRWGGRASPLTRALLPFHFFTVF